MKTSHKNHFLVTILGPTGVGKTSISVLLAREFNTEIISADSRQIYQGLNIGTAKPGHEILSEIPHHLIDCIPITETYNAGRYEQDALHILGGLFKKHGLVIMVGGSGMYIQAVIDGLDDIPQQDYTVRKILNKIYEDEGIDPLLEELLKKDQKYYYEVDRKNPRRIIRALEVIRATGQPFSSFRRSASADRAFTPIKIGLNLDRGILYSLIEERMDQMIGNGLFEEAEKFYKWRDQPALQTVGYQEIFDFIEGKYDREEAIRLLKRNSRRYAKRQLTWFKKDPGITWFEPNQYDDIVAHVKNKTKGN